jgi:hypothetical protein
MYIVVNIDFSNAYGTLNSMFIASDYISSAVIDIGGHKNLSNTKKFIYISLIAKI